MKFSKPLLVVILYICSSLLLIAQSNDYVYKAKEGWLATKQEFQGYELVVITVTGTSDYEDTFNFNTGTSEEWGYIYRDPQDNATQLFVIVLKDGSDYMTIPFDNEVLVPDQVKKLDNVDWIDSDAFVNHLKQNQTFIDFMDKYKNDIFTYVIELGYLIESNEEEFPPQFINKYVWRFITDVGFDCYTNAITGETYCTDFSTDVINLTANDEQVIITPNPATDYIDVMLSGAKTAEGSGAANPNLRLKVYDVSGNVVDTPPGPLLIEGESVRIDVSGLAAGVYFVRLGGRMYKFVKM